MKGFGAAAIKHAKTNRWLGGAPLDWKLIPGCHDTINNVDWHDCPYVSGHYQATPSIHECRSRCLHVADCYAIEWADNTKWSGLARSNNCYLLKNEGNCRGRDFSTFRPTSTSEWRLQTKACFGSSTLSAQETMISASWVSPQSDQEFTGFSLVQVSRWRGPLSPAYCTAKAPTPEDLYFGTNGYGIEWTKSVGLDSKPGGSSTSHISYGILVMA